MPRRAGRITRDIQYPLTDNSSAGSLVYLLGGVARKISLVRGPARRNPGEIRALAVVLALPGGTNVDEAGHPLVVGEPEGDFDRGAVGVPLGEPAGGEP